MLRIYIVNSEESRGARESGGSPILNVVIFFNRDTRENICILYVYAYTASLRRGGLVIRSSICYNYNILYIFDDGLMVTTGKYYILYIE